MNGSLLKAGAVSLWFEREGGGTPLLMVTGLGYATWCWAGLRTALRERWDLLMFDNRGTGRSDKPAGPYTMAMLADDAAAVMQAAGVARAHVLGHSMGGYISLTLAERHPLLVRSLTLIGTSPGGPGTLPLPEETQTLWDENSKLPPAESARRGMPQSFAPGWTARHPQEFEALLARRLEYPTPPACWLAQYHACVHYVVHGIDVSRITAPSLVIHGVQDRVVPHHNGELLAQRLPHARFVSLPESGHLPFLEEPARVAQLIRSHLESVK